MVRLKKMTGILLVFCMIFLFFAENTYAMGIGDVELQNFTKTTKKENKDPNEIRILIVGNSLIKRNNSALILEKMLSDAGYHPHVEAVLKVGVSMRRFLSTNNPQGKRVNSLLKKKKWDYVILQDASRAVFGKKRDMLADFEKLNRMSKAAGAKVALFLTWAPQDGHPVYGRKRFPATEELFLEKVYQKYQEYQKKLGTLLIPTGIAFYNVQRKYPYIDPYSWDLMHPNEEGSYLSACCMYMTITGKSPEKLGFFNQMEYSTAKKLQKAAYQTCINQDLYEMNQGVD